MLALGPRARLPADSKSLEADQAQELAGPADEALRWREQNGKDQDDLKAKSSAEGQKIQPAQSPPSSQCRTTAPAGQNNS
jgi:hypothetical protein